ncbi:ab-hydrolase associated lipase, putative [Talaromyces stipitatus ATCC 10500]|uniref:Ab-hydrolase associated lipase, putative n=1 Tax=Talaromyces stipitatus (strain ATCC 10500 / CBS 375.48 / QM 6759 / NRRL 1006) TaxID=441959 RepID=B8MQC8_TALSN|nr:ab-hydrolase associated lipase, putative [Talaromyces stipitatus ATCC 10500]EED13330.1 ab-hydrolase associated lipase, putative [Talaromyces stipitatus ATCC 10500]
MSFTSIPSTSTTTTTESKHSKVHKFAKQAQKLSRGGARDEEQREENVAIAARFVTPRDAIIETVDGERLPAVPVEEAKKLNRLRDEAVDGEEEELAPNAGNEEEVETKDAVIESRRESDEREQSPESHGGPLECVKPPAHTHPLFPPVPLYGPSSLLRTLQCQTFRAVSFCLSLSFLGMILMGACMNGFARGRYLDAERPFYKEELERESVRREAAKRWERRQKTNTEQMERSKEQERIRNAEDPESDDEYPPLEGGRDPIVCDIGYYARRVGLDVEAFKVQTEDGFILTLWHVYNPNEYTPLPETERDFRQPDVFRDRKARDFPAKNGRYPVLLIHGLLQSSGAYCVNDEDSLAFFLCKAGYDVWLGDNRCGFEPRHKTLKYSDPRMWCWNIRHMGVLDLPAFISRVLYETGFEKLGLICHSQGTTEAMVALAEDQRPDLGERISIFCGLAPAAYAGPLIKKAYFRFMRIISPSAFRVFFGIHAFIPLMMTMHSLLPSRLYGALGYMIFSYLFDWSDKRWDRGLRDRMFQFSPVYVSAESMRWWLGRDGFAVQKCILATDEQVLREDEEDLQIDENHIVDSDDIAEISSAPASTSSDKQKTAWYGPQTPPFAFWVAGSDGLVDGRRLLRRMHNGREPHVNLVHEKIIEGYEHLDVLWAIDAIEQVSKEVAEVVWRTVPENEKGKCRVPRL